MKRKRYNIENYSRSWDKKGRAKFILWKSEPLGEQVFKFHEKQDQKHNTTT